VRDEDTTNAPPGASQAIALKSELERNLVNVRVSLRVELDNLVMAALDTIADIDANRLSRGRLSAVSAHIRELDRIITEHTVAEAFVHPAAIEKLEALMGRREAQP